MWNGRSEIKLLLWRGANINAKDIQARSPLHLAGIEGNDDIYDLLLDSGADPEAKDFAGWTARQYLTEVQERRLEAN
jgi:ankyrin repeat protein